MKKPQHFVSVDHDLNEREDGRWFVDPSTGAFQDLTDFNVVSFRTDTVRQQYRGRIKPGILGIFDKPGTVKHDGRFWHGNRIGKDSGYQYKLQNADLGVILLIKSFHADAESEGNHLKIELSPHFIHAQTERELQFLIDSFADSILDQWQHSGCAVHIAADVQGWKPSRDFEARLHCRSRRVRSFTGMDEFDVDSMAARYGRGESFLFGSPTGVQLAVYDKEEEAKVRDKLDYWRNVWKQNRAYDESQAVYRIEIRFHHSVINQFGDGTADPDTGEVLGMRRYQDVYSHLSGLWRYGCESFRLLHRPGLVDPVWTILGRQTVTEISEVIDYRRHYKKSDTFSGKNIELLLGNFISCSVRHQMTKRNTWEAIKRMPFFGVIIEYYRTKDKSEKDLRKHLYGLHDERVIRYGRAV